MVMAMKKKQKSMPFFQLPFNAETKLAVEQADNGYFARTAGRIVDVKCICQNIQCKLLSGDADWFTEKLGCVKAHFFSLAFKLSIFGDRPYFIKESEVISQTRPMILKDETFVKMAVAHLERADELLQLLTKKPACNSFRLKHSLKHVQDAIRVKINQFKWNGLQQMLHWHLENILPPSYEQKCLIPKV